jgi:DNA-binding transcriptional regulator YiaG
MGEEPLDQSGAGDNALVMSKLPTMPPEELRAIRTEMGDTQAQAAERYGVDLRSYKRWELGERSIPGPVVVLSGLLLKEFRRKPST